MNFLSSSLPWRGLLLFPALLMFIGVLLFSTATLAFYVKQRTSFTRLQKKFAQRGKGRSTLLGNALAALLGAATPFCTCTAVPLFLGMLEVEVPLGPAISFLLASPTINLGAIVLLLIVFGWHLAAFYAGACLLAAVCVGWLLGRIPRERALCNYFWLEDDEPEPGKAGTALKQAFNMGGQFTRKLLPWLALATLAGILIDAFVPTSSVTWLGHLGAGIGIPLAALLGSLIYADILFLIPIGYALIQHGASVAIVLTFMIAASGLSLPEIVVLTRILRFHLVLFFAAATICVYILLGFGFTLL